MNISCFIDILSFNLQFSNPNVTLFIIIFINRGTQRYISHLILQISRVIEEKNNDRGRVPRNSTRHNLVLRFSSRRLINHQVSCSLAARAFSRRASLYLKFICFTLERAGVPFPGMTHKSSLRRARRAAPRCAADLLLPSFPRSFERTRGSHDADHLAISATDPEQARVVTDILGGGIS